MAMPAEQLQWTVEMLDALPDDGQRYELVDGELLAEHLEWQPAGMPEPLVLSIPESFEDALG